MKKINQKSQHLIQQVSDGKSKSTGKENLRINRTLQKNKLLHTHTDKHTYIKTYKHEISEYQG